MCRETTWLHLGRLGFADTAKQSRQPIQRRAIVMQDVTLKNEAPIGLDRYAQLRLQEKPKPPFAARPLLFRTTSLAHRRR